MLIIHILRSLYKSLRGDGTPWQIALGFALGAWLGILPWSAPDAAASVVGFNLTWFLLLGGVIVIRCSFHAAVVGFLVFNILAVTALDPIVADFGAWFLDHLAPRGLIETMYLSSTLALLQLHEGWILGGFVLGAVIGVGCFVFGRWAVLRYRDRVNTAMENSKILKTLRKIWLFRFLRWVFVGGSRVV